MFLLAASCMVALNVGRGLRGGLVLETHAATPGIWSLLPESGTADLGRAPRSSRSLSSDSRQLTQNS